MSSSDPAFADRRLAILQEMAELGLQMAYRLSANREPDGETALAFQRTSKAVRQTLALEARFAGDLEVKQRAETQRQAEAIQKAERAAAVQARDVRMDQTQDIVERLIEAEPAERREDLFEDLGEWLDDVGADKIFNPDACTLGALVADICEDLGLAPDWTAFADEAWAAELITPDRPPAGAWVAEQVTPPRGPNLTRPIKPAHPREGGDPSGP